MINTVTLRSIVGSTLAWFSGETITVHLFTNNITLTPETLKADLVEATFTGYAPDTTLFTGAAWDNPEGDAILSFDSVHFQPSAAVSEVIYGWWMETSATEFGPEPIAMGLFPAPIPLNSAADAVDLIPHFCIGQPVNPPVATGV